MAATPKKTAHDQLNRDAAIAAASGYDADGNLISDGVRTFTYDAENRLTSVAGGSAPLSLAYDPWGRIATLTSNTTVTQFHYDGADLVEEDAGTTTTCCTRARAYVDIGQDEPVLWAEGTTTSSTLSWFHQDRQGSVIAVSNGSGVITPYVYGPYGEPQSWAGSRLRYTGQVALPEAQLYSYRARVYDPMMGRFLEADPIHYNDGPNIYAYVHGDPVNGADPSGMIGLDEQEPGGGMLWDLATSAFIYSSYNPLLTAADQQEAAKQEARLLDKIAAGFAALFGKSDNGDGQSTSSDGWLNGVVGTAANPAVYPELVVTAAPPSVPYVGGEGVSVTGTYVSSSGVGSYTTFAFGSVSNGSTMTAGFFNTLGGPRGHPVLPSIFTCSLPPPRMRSLAPLRGQQPLAEWCQVLSLGILMDLR